MEVERRQSDFEQQKAQALESLREFADELNGWLGFLVQRCAQVTQNPAGCSQLVALGVSAILMF